MMRSRKFLLESYRKVVPGASSSDGAPIDVALVDLCLHLLVRLDIRDPSALPFLLQGYSVVARSRPLERHIANVRLLAATYSSSGTWKAACDRHAAAPFTTAYVLEGKHIQQATAVIPDVKDMLNATLLARVPFTERKIQYAKPGSATFSLRRGGVMTFEIPKLAPESNDSLPLRTRSDNPPIALSWDDLYAAADRVDEAESKPDWPNWLPPSHLRKRLERVQLKPIGENGLGRGSHLVLDGLHHVAGMLSSGKSTFLQALLHAVAGGETSRSVLVLTRDTASSAALTARLSRHGIKTCLISSVYNRDEHLSAIHWSNAGGDLGQVLGATAEESQQLATACPLEGLQPMDEDAFRQANMSHRAALPMRERPCHRLVQSGSADNAVPDALTLSAAGKANGSGRPQHAKNASNRTCPLIHKCPTHGQQAQIGHAAVYVMTVQAFVHMRPAPHIVKEGMSFPELFQHLVDLVLVDEVDSVQNMLDEAFRVEESLLSNDDTSYTFQANSTVMAAVHRQGGRPYREAVNTLWHARFNLLQNAMALLYQLLLSEHDHLKWLTDNKTFTSASVLTDLLRVARRHQSGGPEASISETEIRAVVDTLARSGLATDDDATHGENSHDTKVPDDIRQVLDAIAPLQSELLSDCSVTESRISAVIEAITATNSLSALNAAGATVGRGRRRYALSLRSCASGFVLAALTNACVSLFSWLVRHHAAVEDDFKLDGDDMFQRVRRLGQLYRGVVPDTPAGSAYGLIFERHDENAGASLRIVYHVGVGRYLLTHLNRLNSPDHQAGPHVLMLSGTSWAGGSGNATSEQQTTSARRDCASPRFDVQIPVSAILEQPEHEREAIRSSRFEIGPVTPEALAVSGVDFETRRDNLRAIVEALVKPGAAGSRLSHCWDDNRETWGDQAMKDRRRAIAVCSNYADARACGLFASQAAAGQHPVYVLVPDDEAKRQQFRPNGDQQSPVITLLPRSRIEQFGRAPPNAILFAPIQPISRGHNILNPDGRAGISALYFLHRPHPRPDALDGVVAEVNRFAIQVVNGGRAPPADMSDVDKRGRWLRTQGRRLVDEALASRVGYSSMGADDQSRFAWDLLTLLWQTIGRGIRSGVPVYVRFVDERFAPNPKTGTRTGGSENCLRKCVEVLEAAIETEKNELNSRQIADTLYSPFLTALRVMFDSIDQSGLDSQPAGKRKQGRAA